MEHCSAPGARNGAYTAMLYGNWRSDRIAAIGQYAGADPWARTPCPVAVQATKKVPLVLLRNLCDALVPCSTTDSWIATLKTLDWPFQAYSITDSRNISTDMKCAATCPKALRIADHVRWPDTQALTEMLAFLHQHTLH